MNLFNLKKLDSPSNITNLKSETAIESRSEFL